MGDVLDNEPELFNILKDALNAILLSKVSEDYEYGSLYLTSNIISAYLYAKKAYAGGEFAFAAYALAKAAKAKGLEDWYLNEELPTMGQFVDILIKVAEETPQPVIYKLIGLDPKHLRTEANESIDRYIRNGRLYATEFRYTDNLDLNKFEYEVVDEKFIERMKNS